MQYPSSPPYNFVNHKYIGKKNPYKKNKFEKKYKANYQIKALQVFVIGENGEQLGLMDIRNAISKAQDAELDLVEVSPNIEPPVCKILDYGQFQYDKSKKQKSVSPKKVLTKIIRLSFKIGQHDLDVKKKQVEKFLGQKHKVRVELNLKGREKQHTDLAKEVVEKLLSEIKDKIVMEQELKILGGKISIIIKSK
ncbi:MAG: translation initiation factor IF-3 [Patescibacteria group bacterium]|nr:translation initiation factor IF-3 [Patescibacteria group bacterium]MDD4304567.1 translation initiation factor IF-3 [Patescibacteria group bacterium]MDD4695754.1 translation initiation factor IF-3 [Patescibacteria group bacterium]